MSEKQLPSQMDIPPDVARRISRSVTHSYVGLLLERTLQAFWLFGSLCLLFAASMLFSVTSVLSSPARDIVLGIWGVFALVALVTGATKFRMPTRSAARAMVDGALDHRPLQALSDTPSAPDADAASLEIWRAHKARMLDRARKVAPVAPDLRLARFDPYGLRLMALTVFAMAALFGGIAGDRSGGGRSAGETVATGPVWEGWVEPPSYTGKPSLYLADLSDRFSVPRGSAVTVRLYGADDALKLRQTVAKMPSLPDAKAHQFRVETDGEIAIDGPSGRAWSVALLPDQAPVAQLLGDMTRAPLGEARQPFILTDDFGVARGQISIVVDMDAVQRRYGFKLPPEPRAPIEVALALPQTGDRSRIEGVLSENFSLHPFSGLPVKISLQAWDQSGQVSEAALGSAILPGRRFFDPLAAALIDLRRELLWNRGNSDRAAQVLRAVTYVSDGLFGDDPTLLSRVQSIVYRIEGAEGEMSDEFVSEISQELWDIAVLLEEGELSEALERLRRAQERLSQAMRDGATPEEIARLMQELRDATREYMRKLAEQQDGETDNTAQNENAQEMSPDQLQQLMDRIQELMEEGRMSEAQQLMDMLNELLENMQVTQSQGGGEGQQAMEGLQDMLREQQQLNDDTFSDLQDQFSQDQNQQGRQGERDGQEQGQNQQRNGEQSGRSEEGNAQGEGREPMSLSERQQTLREELERQQRQLPFAGNGDEDGSGAALDDAERAMNEAEEALRNEDFVSALDSQAEAMEALREGMRQLSRELSQARQNQDGSQGEASGQSGDAEQRDPLGRAEGETGQLGTDDGAYEGDNANKRAQDLVDELRRRSAEQERTQEELDYLKRLLDRF